MKRQLGRLLACLPLLLAHAWGQGLDVMFVLEMSPGTEQQVGLIRTRDLKEGDRAGVIGFARSVQLLEPLTEDRNALAKALQRAGIRVEVGIGTGSRPVQGYTVDLAGAIREALGEFQDDGTEKQQRVVIVLAASEDPGLQASLGSLQTTLKASNARLFGVAITRVSGLTYSYPTLTAQSLKRLAKDSRGKVFEGAWDLNTILAAARKP